MRILAFAFAITAAALSQTAGAITATKEYVDRKDATNAAAIAELAGTVSNHTEHLQEIDLRFETTPTLGDVAAVEDKILDVRRGLETNVSHIVSNVVTKSYVEDLGISGGGGDGGLTTNDVCAIVTNVVPWWTFSPPSIRIEGELRTILAEPSGDHYDMYAGSHDYPLSYILFPGSSLVFVDGSDDGEIEITATWSPRNAIGLARLEDVPSTNGFVTAEEATNMAETASSIAVANADTTYRRTIGITNINQSVQYVSITDETPSTLEIQLPTDGATKDWMVYVVSVTNVTLSLPAAIWWMADVAYTNEVPPATPTALWFSQVTDGIFILGRQELTEVTAP